MNGTEDNLNQDESDNSSDEEQTNVTSLRDKRRKYYEERKKRMAQRAGKPASMSEMLNSEEDHSVHHNLANEKRFFNIRVHASVRKHTYEAKEEDDKDHHLKWEIEIADYLTFEELIPKAIEQFNSLLKDMNAEASFAKDQVKKFNFRFSRKDGTPDINFPKFDNQQKVSDSGVTNIWLVFDDDWVNYLNASTNKSVITAAETEHSLEYSGGLEPRKSKQGQLKKNSAKMDNLSKTNSSWKCIIF